MDGWIFIERKNEYRPPRVVVVVVCVYKCTSIPADVSILFAKSMQDFGRLTDYREHYTFATARAVASTRILGKNKVECACVHTTERGR